MSYFDDMLMKVDNRLMHIADSYGCEPPVATNNEVANIVPPINMSQDDHDLNQPGVGVVTRTKPKTDKPKLYKVLLLNDDYTPMEFVVHVLRAYFQMDTDEATRVMLHVHQKGFGICGVFTYEVAETKVTQVMDFARKNDHPLQCTLEKE